MLVFDKPIEWDHLSQAAKEEFEFFGMKSTERPLVKLVWRPMKSRERFDSSQELGAEFECTAGGQFELKDEKRL